MMRRLVPLLIGAIFMLVPLALMAQREGLQTNASSGAFNRDQRLWFSAPQTDRLVLSLDGKELFKGIGSASVLLSVPLGSEKTYTILVQRRSAPPLNSLLEEKTFTIHIDKQQPQKPVLSGSTDDGLFYSVTAESEENAVLEGLYSLAGMETHINRNEKSSSFARVMQAPFNLIIWAVDAAGNYSEPAVFSAEVADFSILNPMPGIWQNVQRLVIQKNGSGEIYWTDDGSDPFSDSGRLYETPLVIQKYGKVRLRIGMKLPNGLRYEKSLDYEVVDTGKSHLGESPFTVPEEVHESSTLNLDGDFQWSLEGGPWLDKRVPIRLVPVQSYQRYVVLLLKTAHGTYRYPILLDGRVMQGHRAAVAEASEPNRMPQETEKSDESLQSKKEIISQEPLLVTAGDVRVLYWKNTDMGIIRYRLNDEKEWNDYTAPIVVPPGPVRITWLLDKGIAQEGPNQQVFTEQSSPPSSPGSYGWIVYRSLYPEPGAFHILDRYNTEEPIPVFTACTGEDLEWKVYSADGEELFVQRTDRLPPLEPILSAPSEGAWVSGAITIQSSIPANEEGVRTLITADLQYPSGRVEQRQGENSLELEVPKESPVVVSLTTYALDAAGNQSPVVSRTFTIDANSVYVSSRGSPDGDGSRNRPVNSLELALELAKQLGRSSIRIKDVVSVDTPLPLVPGLSLESISTERPGEIHLIKEGRLLITSSSVALRRLAIRSETQSSPAIEVLGGNLEMTDTSLFMKGSVLRAIVGTSGTINLENTTINLDALESATALWAEDCIISSQNTTITVKAGKYANGVELRRGRFIQEKGSVFIAAQDGSIWQFYNPQNAEINRVQATLVSNFVARACVSEGVVPKLTNSVVVFKGRSPTASVFMFSHPDSFLQIPESAKGSISGNYFIGFSSLLNDENMGINIRIFNRTFAAPDTPNFIDEVP